MVIDQNLEEFLFHIACVAKPEYWSMMGMQDSDKIACAEHELRRARLALLAFAHSLSSFQE